MKSAREIQEQIRWCTDPAQYDQLQQELTAAQKAEALEQARQLTTEAERLRQEQARHLAEHNQLVTEIQALYRRIEGLDRDIFKAVRELVDGMRLRVELAAQAKYMEVRAFEDSHRVNYLPRYEYKAPALVGGACLLPTINGMLKLWLQRYIAWSNRVGKVTLEQINSHGLEGGTENADEPDKF